MSYIVVDVESDGLIPHKYSMVCFGAVVLEPTLSKTFYGKTKPISELWIPEALTVSGISSILILLKCKKICFIPGYKYPVILYMPVT